MRFMKVKCLEQVARALQRKNQCHDDGKDQKEPKYLGPKADGFGCHGKKTPLLGYGKSKTRDRIDHVFSAASRKRFA
jgi:hypothetical protein